VILALLWARQQAIAAEKSLTLLARSNQFQAFQSIAEKAITLRETRDQIRMEGVPSYKELKTKYGEVHKILACKELAPILDIGGFYEYVGVLVTQGLIDFDLVFELMPMPTEIWESAESLVAGLRNEWIDDFWINWERLIKMYKTQRAKGKLAQKP
jgi:hypothetical protein